MVFQIIEGGNTRKPREAVRKGFARPGTPIGQFNPSTPHFGSPASIEYFGDVYTNHNDFIIADNYGRPLPEPLPITPENLEYVKSLNPNNLVTGGPTSSIISQATQPQNTINVRDIGGSNVADFGFSGGSSPSFGGSSAPGFSAPSPSGFGGGAPINFGQTTTDPFGNQGGGIFGVPSTGSGPFVPPTTTVPASTGGGGGTGSVIGDIALAVGPALVNAYFQNRAAKEAGKGLEAAQGIQRDQFNLIQGLLSPFVGAGVQALDAQKALLGFAGPEAEQALVESVKASPSYQAQLQEGEEAILANASATGGLRGGNTQAALAQFRPQLLSNEIERRYQKLAGLSQLGQASAAGTAQLTQAPSLQLSDLSTQAGELAGRRQQSFGQGAVDLFSTIRNVGGF